MRALCQVAWLHTLLLLAAVCVLADMKQCKDGVCHDPPTSKVYIYTYHRSMLLQWGAQYIRRVTVHIRMMFA